MPKKTRREKIRASERKEQAAHFTFTAQQTLKPSTVNSYPTARISGDIVKTVSLGSMFIVAEIVLYFLAGRLGW